MKWKMKEPEEFRLCETMVTMRIRLEWKSVVVRKCSVQFYGPSTTIKTFIANIGSMGSH